MQWYGYLAVFQRVPWTEITRVDCNNYNDNYNNNDSWKTVTITKTCLYNDCI